MGQGKKLCPISDLQAGAGAGTLQPLPKPGGLAPPPTRPKAMLQQMRDRFRYLRWLLVVIILMFVWWAVSVWSGGMTNRRSGEDWAATVNGTSITMPAFQAYARRLDGTYQSLLGDSYAQQRALIHIGQQAIDALIDEELAFQEALRQGITVTPQEVSEAILRDPGFQENGRFIGVQRYRSLFRGARMSVEEYEDQVRRGLVVAKFRSLIEDGVTVGEVEIREEFDRRNAKESVDYVVADPGKLRHGSAPTDAEVGRFYEAHRDRYARGEGRTGFYVLFSSDAPAAGASISDAEVRAAYDRDRDTRFTLKEQRRASHILLKVPADAPPAAVAKDEATARGILKRARAGEDFAGLARKYSEDSSATAGGDLNFFSRGQMVKEFEDAAFGLPVGGLSDLVRTPYGFHIIKVTDARPGRTVPFEEARDGLRQEMQRARARAEAGKRSLDLARAAAGGKLEAVAKSQGLTVSETGPVHDGEGISGLAGSQAVVARMMALAPGDVSDPIPISAGQVVVQVTGTVLSERRPLQEVRARVEKDLTDDRARESVALEVASARRSGGGLRTLARSLKLEIKTQPDLLMGSPLPGVPADPELTRQLASLPPGTIGEPVVTTVGIVVLSVTGRNDHRLEFDAQKDSIKDNLVRQRQDRIYRAFTKRLRSSGSVVVNDTAVRALDRSS